MSSETIAGVRDNYTIVRAFTATDDAKQLFKPQTITVQTPTTEFTFVPADYTVSAPTRCPWTTPASDSCGEVTIEVSARRPLAMPGSYTIVRTQATDDAGNSSSAQTMVQDTTAPEFTFVCRLHRRVLRRDAHGRRHGVRQLRRGDDRSVQRDDRWRCRATTPSTTFTADDAETLFMRSSRYRTPQLLNSPSSTDYTVECSDEMPMDDATADNYGEVTIEVSSERPRRCCRRLHHRSHVRPQHAETALRPRSHHGPGHHRA